MKRIVIVIIATVIAVVCFNYFFDGKATETTDTEDEETDYLDIPLSATQVKTAGLTFGQAEERDIDMTLSANGQIVLRSKDKGNVASLMSGIVKEIFVTEGQHVAKGQTVATIENTDIVSLQREYYEASKECEFAGLDLKRQEELNESGAGVRRNLQEAKKELNIAQARMQGIAQQLSQLGIDPGRATEGRFETSFPVKAPISGTVSEIEASLGSFADMQTPLMKIRDNSAVECDLNVFEKDLGKIKIGDNVLITLINEPGTREYGRVYGVNQYFTDGTKSVAVHVKLLSEDSRLFDGEYVTGRISIGRESGKALPSKAIISSDGKSYIFALNGIPDNQEYHFSRHEVTTGETSDGYTAIKFCSHIKDGQEIVIGNAFYLASMIGDHGEE